jgi:protein phosphatase
LNESAVQSGEITLGGISVCWSGASDIGKDRVENQDAFFIEAEIGLFLVSDGMGGHRGGALAANIVAEDLPVMIEISLAKLRSSSVRSVRGLLKRCMVEQNRHLRMEGDSESGYKEMGTTVAVALVKDGRVYLGNLGDSRVYRFRKGHLRQLSKDHSVVGELVSKGKLSVEDAENHDAAHEITHYVGMEEKADPHVRSFALSKGDRIVLCTDGLTSMVSDREIAEIIRKYVKADSTCKALIDAANAAGGHDNITVIVVDLEV